MDFVSGSERFIRNCNVFFDEKKEIHDCVTCIRNKSKRWNVVILVSRIREGRGSQRKQSRRSCESV